MRQPMPESIRPMMAVTTDRLPDDDDRRANEIKWDGYRIIAFVRSGRVRLQTRTLLDATAEFFELGGLGEAVPGHDAVLDGEIVGLDDEGRPSFGALQRRGIRRPTVVYMIFDLLHLDGRNTTGLAYHERRARLEDLAIRPGRSWQVPAYHVDDGAGLLEATRTLGLEGIISKRLDGTYEPGRRSRSWLKIKNWGRQEFVVGGWMPGEAGRSGRLGSLLVGYYDGGGSLRYAGRVGTGFTMAELARLEEALSVLRRSTSPFGPEAALPVDVQRKGRFVEPRLVAEVAFSEWTHTGTIRQPSYKGLRADKRASEVVREA
jgi:bifunctional non-homologous end joining protein LigD